MDLTSQNKQWLLDKLGPSDDLEHRTMKSPHMSLELLFITNICDSVVIREEIIQPFFQMHNEIDFENYLLSFPGCDRPASNVDSLNKIMSGFVAILFQDHILLFQAAQIKAAALSDAQVEATIQGPQTAFSEHIDTNLNLIRFRYKNSSLRVESREIGRLSRSKLCLLYDDMNVDHEVLDQLKKKLDHIKVDNLQSVTELHQLLTKQKYTLFPTFINTERPDRAILNISQGKIIIMLEGTPFVLILPAVFFDFYSAMDDNYQLSLVGYFLQCLRYVALFLSLVLPAAYVALTAYNPEIFRVQLALSIAGSRASVPYPAYVEVLLMLGLMELLLEASIRLPKSVGSTATTVGGLILGQAATSAGLISNIMIIIVSTVAISNFVVPVNSMSFAMRIMKYPLVLLASMLGITGLVLGLIGMISYLTNLRSFGVPYLRIFFYRK
ncbi:spore germination protein [Paenibacillus sp. HWE-109]|uniref:spore germination protein n=1 Tax=Paenibacillus sp. HWE-109 TaxID=1306526 RepID=UPI001EDFF8E3|nr:spore germination protein [Paenibacillus sp. HWE-109]UKS30124.1 spore germination protein [Paenibacillus sp. HWE-109]